MALPRMEIVNPSDDYDYRFVRRGTGGRLAASGFEAAPERHLAPAEYDLVRRLKATASTAPTFASPPPTPSAVPPPPPNPAPGRASAGATGSDAAKGD